MRQARPEEAAQVADLVEQAYAPWVPIIGRRPAPMQDDYAARCAAGEAWVLERDGRIAGLIVLEDGPGHLYIDNVAVDASLKGQGLGRQLMAFAEDEARRRGVGEVRLFTNALMAANIALYRRLGYVETDRRQEHGFARVFMAKVL